MSRSDAADTRALAWHRIAVLSPGVWCFVAGLAFVWGIWLSQIEGHGAELLAFVIGWALATALLLIGIPTLVFSPTGDWG